MLKSWKVIEAKLSGGKDKRTGAPLKLVLHVGPHKTGTTSLQKALLKQYGSEKPEKIWYPKPIESGPGHALLVRQVLGRRGHPPSPAIRELIEQAQASSCQCLIISSEDIASIYQNEIEPMAQQVTGVDVHIVVTLSSVARRALSIWQELVKHRSLISLESAGEMIMRRHGLAPDFVCYFANNLPDAQVSVIIADRNAPESLYKLFGEATGIPLSAPNSAKDLVANQGLGLIEANMLSGFNVSVANTAMGEEDYRHARGLLRSLFRTAEWRAVVPMVALSLPQNWVAPLKKQCTETIAELRRLTSIGRVRLFGDVDSLDDLDLTSKEVDPLVAPAAERSILVAGLAKSGTTALYYKIKEAMPANTYCLFEPKVFDEWAVAGGRNVLAKVLLLGTEIESFSHFAKKVLIVRDPRDRIVSRALYRIFNCPELCRDRPRVAEFIDLLRKKEASPRSVSILDVIRLGDRLTGTEHLTTTADAIRKLVDFQDAHPDFFTYRYEDLVRGNFTSLSRYLDLELTHTEPQVAAKVSRVSRTKGSGDWGSWFVDEDVAYFRPLLDPYMQSLGYADDWRLGSEPSIAPEHGSEYVLRLVRERGAFEDAKTQNSQESAFRSSRQAPVPETGVHGAMKRLLERVRNA